MQRRHTERPAGYSVSHLEPEERIAQLERMLERERAKAKRHRTRLADVTTRMATEWASLIREGMERAWEEGWQEGIAHASSVNQSPTDPSLWVIPEKNPYATEEKNHGHLAH